MAGSSTTATISATSCRFGSATANADHLVIPFSFETNDNRFDQNNGFSIADDFAAYLTDCSTLLYEEGADIPKVMSISLHDRLLGRPTKPSA